MLRGGVPCVRGTRLPVAQVLAELADHGEAVRELAQELDQDVDAVREAVRWAASQIDRPFVTRCPAVGPYGHQCEYEEGHPRTPRRVGDRVDRAADPRRRGWL